MVNIRFYRIILSILYILSICVIITLDIDDFKAMIFMLVFSALITILNLKKL